MYRTRALTRMGVPASMQYRVSGYGLGGQAGDFLGIGKALKKIKLGSVIRPLLGAVPGVGPLLSTAAGVLTNPQRRMQAERDLIRRLPGGKTALDLTGLGAGIPEMMPGGTALSTPDFRDVVGGGGSTAPPPRIRGSLPPGLHFPSAGLRRKKRTVVDITAVRHAMSRLERFEKVARKVVHFTHPTRHGATVARFKGKGRKR